MKVFILGAGASVHAGYPLASNLGLELAKWVEQTKPIDHDYRILIDQVAARFGKLENLEEFLICLDRPRFASDKAVSEDEKVVLSGLRAGLKKAICDYFDDVRQANNAEAYECFAEHHVHAGDVILTFNYDVSLDRELRKAAKWEVGNGYGLGICPNLTPDSPVKLLKLHGSTNWCGQLFGGALGFGHVSPDSKSLGFRPVIQDSEFNYLCYQELKDPLYKAAVDIHPLILPARDKRFYEETTYGREWEQFWDALWNQAKTSLQQCQKLFILGYSLPLSDTRARDLIFENTKRDGQVEICCLAASDRIAREFCNHGFLRVRSLNNLSFEKWVEK
jgi:hypothetical protein